LLFGIILLILLIVNTFMLYIFIHDHTVITFYELLVVQTHIVSVKNTINQAHSKTFMFLTYIYYNQQNNIHNDSNMDN
jgi:hypothetical protein